MKYLPAAIASPATLLPVTKANFDIYYTGVGGFAPPIWGYTPYTNDLDYGQVSDAFNWRIKDDVSGGKWGVRCDGDGCHDTSNGHDRRDRVQLP